MDHPFGIYPAGSDPALYKIIKVFCDSRICQLHGMAGIYNTCFFILASQDQYTSPGIEQKAPVINLLHINHLPPGINPHKLFCNRCLFYPHPSRLLICPQLRPVSGHQSILIQPPLRPGPESLENQASFWLSCGHIALNFSCSGACVPARISVWQRHGRNPNNMPGSWWEDMFCRRPGRFSVSGKCPRR